MNFKKFEGIFPALVTPFDEAGKLKENGLRQIVKYLIEVQKINGLYVTGSTGEFLLLSLEERKRIFKIVAEEAKGKITLIAQVGSLNLPEVITLVKYAEELGYDAASAITPFYYGFSFAEVKGYYEEISKNTNLPMLIYYLPQLAGSKVGLEQFGQLLSIKNVIGCKYGANDVYLFERLLSAFPEKLFMFAWDEALTTGLLLGAKGFIGSTYNVNAQGVRDIMESFNKNDLVKLRKLIHKYSDFVEALLASGLMQTIKAIMALDGVDAGYNRKPFKFIHHDELKQKAQKIKDQYLKR